MKNGNCSILLVDDDHDDAEMVMYSLRKLAGLEIKHMDGGEEALQYLFSEDVKFPSLILLDLRMPKVDGIEVLKKLKASPQTQRVPVAVLISSTDGKRYVEKYGIKPDAYLMKPVTAANFLQIIVELGLAASNTTEQKSHNHQGDIYPPLRQ